MQMSMSDKVISVMLKNSQTMVNTKEIQIELMDIYGIEISTQQLTNILFRLREKQIVDCYIFQTSIMEDNPRIAKYYQISLGYLIAIFDMMMDND